MLHVVFRNYRATIGSTNIESLSRSLRLYKEKASGLEETNDPLITENKTLQVKWKSFLSAPSQKTMNFLNIRKPHFFASMGSCTDIVDLTYFALWIF